MLGLRVLGEDVGEHLDLVELVHAEDAPGVLAVRARLAAEAGREARVAQRQALGVQDLVHVVGGERHLGRADQVQVVLVEVVDVLGGLAEEAGAGHRLRAHQRRGQHRREAGRRGLRDRRVDQGELQEGAHAGQEVEARAGDLGAALHVDGAEQLAQFQVVPGLEALGGEVAVRAVRLQRDEVLLAADGHVGVDEVAEPLEQFLGLGVGRVAFGVGGLDVGLELFGPLEQLGLLVPGGPADQLAEALLLGAQLVEADAGRPAPFVGGQEGVDERDVLSTGALRRAHTVGVLTEQAKVNHVVKATGARYRLSTHYCRTGPRLPRDRSMRRCPLPRNETPRGHHVDRIPLWRTGLGAGSVHSNPQLGKVIHRVCERSVDSRKRSFPIPVSGRPKPSRAPLSSGKGTPGVTPEDGGQETGGRRVTCTSVGEVGGRRVICRLNAASLSTCPQVEKRTCG